MQYVICQLKTNPNSLCEDNKFIKVATNVRRCRKSAILTPLQELIRKENSTSAILVIRMDMLEFRLLAKIIGQKFTII